MSEVLPGVPVLKAENPGPSPLAALVAGPFKQVKPPKGFPASLTLMGTRWSVVYCRGLVENRNTLGEMHKLSRIIFLDAGLARDEMASTLLHEAMHAIISSSSVDFDLPEDLEERVIRDVAPKVLDLLKSNKGWW